MKKLSLFLIICCLCGCGFSPLYVQKTGDSKWYYNDEFNTFVFGLNSKHVSMNILYIYY